MPDDLTIQIDGDQSFSGVNELLPRAALKPGEVAAAQNCRFRLGEPEPRLGCAKLPWTNKVTSGAASAPIPFGTVYGVGTFRDADDLRWFIIAADGRVYATREGNGAKEILLPSGVSITSAVTFTQTLNGLLMFRGGSLAKLLMKTLDLGWAEAPSNTAALEANTITGALSENPQDGTEPTPNADRGDWIANRLFTPYTTATEKDLVDVSDYLNATRSLGIRSQARINQGSSDKLMRVFKFGRANTALCFKTNSVYALNNVEGALSEMSLDEVTASMGLCAPTALVNVGKEEADAPDEVWFLANKVGLMRVTYDQDGRLGVTQIPVSAELQRTFNRINWTVAAQKATMERWDNYIHLAVPLDDARVLGPEIIRNESYTLGSAYLTVIPGATYYWTKGANDESLTNDSEVLTASGEFTATGVLVLLTSSVSGTSDITASVKRVYRDVNTHILVYDLLRGKWCGADTGVALVVKSFVVHPFDGEDRLFFVGEDGFINCCHYLPYDEVAYETPGENLAPVGTYDASGFVTVTGLLPGRTYLYIIAPFTTRLVNGTQEITSGEGTLVAQGPTIYFFGTPTLTAGSRIMLLDWTVEQREIEYLLETRLYRWGTAEPKRIPWLNLQLRTWRPHYTLTALGQGYNELWELRSGVTRSRTRYERPFTAQPYDASNYNDDHGTRGREDYSVVLGDESVSSGSIQPGLRYAVQSSDVVTACSISYDSVTYNGNDTFVGVAGVSTFTVLTGSPLVYAPGSYVLPGENGIVFDAEQTLPVSVRLDRKLRGVSVRLTNDQGRCALSSITLEGRLAEKHKGERQH